MISTTNNFALACWHRKRGVDAKTKALLFDISDGYATILLESGEFIIDHIEYVTLDSVATVFEQCEWMDGEDE